MKIMGLTPSELKQIKIIGINFLIVLICIISVVWFVQYSRIKKQNLDVKFDDSGHLIARNDRITPLDLEAHELVAQRYYETDQPGKAIPHLKRCLSFKSNNRQLRFKLATAQLDAGNYEQALAGFSRLEDDEREDSLTSMVWAQKGITLFYLGKLSESKIQLESCISRFPESAEAMCYLGQIEAANTADAVKALEHLNRAIRIDSLYVEGWYQLARFTMQQGKYLKARQMLLRALEIDPLHVKCHSRLGMIYYYLHDYAQAKKSYLTALALNPKDFNTRYNLGELYSTAMDDTVNGLQEFKAALKQNPGHVEANFKVGMICLNNNMVKEAIRYFETARANGPENVRVLMQLGVAYEKLGDKAAALQTYDAILAIDALNAIALQKIKYLSGEMEDHDQNQ
jgi:tetratricopeptide (TPR) repeat protein